MSNHEPTDALPLPAKVQQPQLTLPNAIPSWLRYDDHPTEATGCALDSYARGNVAFASMFLGPALLKLAAEAAGCDTSGTDGDYEECDKRVYGFRPSSLLTNIAIISSIATTVCLPLFGAIVDHTPFRKQVGIYSALFLTVFKALEIMVGPSTWMIVACLQVLTYALFGTHNTAVFAYISELSPNNTVMQNKFNTDFGIVNYLAIIIFMLAVLVPSMSLGFDDVQTARLSQVIASSVSGIVFYVAWGYCFSDRPARWEVPPGSSVLSSGFRKTLRTALSIGTADKSAPLKWTICSIALAESGASALVTISTTYITQVLRMSASDMGAIYLIVLLTGIPGSRLGEWVTSRLNNPVRSAQLCHALLVVSTAGAAVQLVSPEDKSKSYVYAVLWGIALGWMTPVHTTSFMSFVPLGSEAEMMGIYLFSIDCISFLPPLVFTALNESGIPMRIGVGSLCVYFLLSMTLFGMIGNFDQAVRKSKTSEYEQPTNDVRDDTIEMELL